jgi:hypothetical protein
VDAALRTVLGGRRRTTDVQRVLLAPIHGRASATPTRAGSWALALSRS